MTVGAVALALSASAAAATHTVVIEGAAYDPPALVVAKGDTVVWVNRDPYPHTVTSGDRSLDSGDIAAGARWNSVANAPGRHPYGCAYHPTMHGMLEVR